MLREGLEAPIGLDRTALPRKHAGGVFPLALEREHAGGEGEITGQVFPQQPFQEFAVILVWRRDDLGNGRAGKAGGDDLRPELPLPDPRDKLVPLVARLEGRPVFQQTLAVVVQSLIFVPRQC